MANFIDPRASVHPTAELGDGIRVGPGAVIEAGVVVGDGCRIAACAMIRSGAVLGREVAVDSFAVVAAEPQDLKFDPRIASGARIGNGTILREGVTVSRATSEGAETVVGDECLLMANSHVAHDCQVGRKVVCANGVLLAGHIHVGDFVSLGGAAVFHQFVRIGESAFVGGGSRMTLDIPPYVMAAERNQVVGLNLVGLSRRGFPTHVVGDLKNCYRAVFMASGAIRDNALRARGEGLAKSAEGRCFLQFFEGGRRKGFVRTRQRHDVRAEPEPEPRPSRAPSIA